MQSPNSPQRTRQITVNTLNTIRSSIAGYAGGPAIARELLQNADDAHAQWIEFHFTPEALIVKNSSVFSERDFSAICDIGSGNKRDEQDKTGTWGTGFLSVYQITDNPEILSAGAHLILDPSEQHSPEYPSSVFDYTEFRFGWRTKPTKISNRIDADIWTTTRIEKFQVDILPEMYRSLIFLRHLTEIRVYNQTHQICEIRRDLVNQQNLENGTTFQRWAFYTSYLHKDKQKTESQISWIVYQKKLPEGFKNTEDKEIKSSAYAIAIEQSADSLTGKLLPGTLYNYLPTEIKTGFNFHINGDFFPDSNRKSIQNIDNSAKSNWNEALINALARLFADNLEHLRDLHKDNPDLHKTFYNLLPVKSTLPYLQAFTEELKNCISEIEVVYTSDKKWTKPSGLKFAPPNMPDIRPLVEPYLSGIVPQDFPEEVKEFFIDSLGSQFLKLSDYLKFLQENIPEGTPLQDAHPAINPRSKRGSEANRAQLHKIYQFLSNQLDNSDIKDFSAVPLCLDRKERLYSAARPNIWRADESFRRVIPLDYEDLILLDEKVQAKFGSLFDRFLQQSGISQLVGELKKLATANDGKPITSANSLFNSHDKLQRIVSYLIQQRDLDNYQKQLGELTLVIDTSHCLRRINSPLRLFEPKIRELLKENEVKALTKQPNVVESFLNIFKPTAANAEGFGFVSPEIEKNSDWVNLVVKAGMRQVTWRNFSEEILKQFFLEADPPLKHKTEWLVKLYRYFNSYAEEINKDSNVANKLRELPFILTQENRLQAAKKLSLPPSQKNSEIEEVASILQLSYLVHESVLIGELRNFFQRTLQITELNSVDYIKKHILAYYADPTNADKHVAKSKLLTFIRNHQAEVLADQQLLISLTQKPLIRCDDDIYRKPSEIYFKSDTLTGIFGDSYKVPHSSYNLSSWKSFFEKLSVQSTPNATDIVSTVKSVALYQKPDKQNIEQIRNIFNFLYKDFNYYKEDKSLQDLHSLAWLPAENDYDQWHKPNELYPASVRHLVGQQVKILPFGQTSREFSDFFGLNVAARLEDVVNHLLWLSENNQSKDENLRIYQYLNDYTEQAEFRQLRNKAIIYDPKKNRYWLPQHTFRGNYYSEFGDYRCYLADFDRIALFLSAVGVRTSRDIADYVELLKEIDSKYTKSAIGKVDHEEDRYLIKNAYLRLAEFLENSKEVKPAWLETLRQSRIGILTTEHDLLLAEDVFFNDRPKLLEYFPPNQIHLADYTDEQDSKARRILAELGVRSFAQSVRRECLSKGETEKPASGYKQQLLSLVPYFRRIKLHYENSSNGFSQGWQDLEWFTKLQVVQVDKLEVRYFLELKGSRLDGKINEEEAFFDKAKSKLYLQINSSDDRIINQLANEIVKLLNPEILPSVIITIVKGLLRLDSADPRFEQKAETLLDDATITHNSAATEKYIIDEKKQQEAVTSYKAAEIPEEAVTSPNLPETPLAVYPPAKTSPAQLEMFGTQQSRATNVIQPTLNKVTSEVKPPKPLEKPNPTILGTHSAPEKLPVHQLETNTKPINPAKPIPPIVKPTPPSPVVPTTAGPAFIGQIRPRVPYIPTNFASLKERFGHLVTENARGQNFTEVDQSIARKSQNSDIDWYDEKEIVPKYIKCARIVLSYQMRLEGFLPLTKQVRALIKNRSEINCQVVKGITFPLYVDSKLGILYNQEDLTAFFADECLPPGAILYFEQQHNETFELYFKQQSHIVRNVRLLSLNENNELIYETIPEMEVPCETAEWVFRADQRLDDNAALFQEAIGKKSVFETIIDIFDFENNGYQALHEDTIFELVFAIRMITRWAVVAELEERECFKEEGSGYWSFDPSLLFARQATPPTTRNNFNRNSYDNESQKNLRGDSLSKTLRNVLQALKDNPDVETLRELQEDYNYFIVEMAELFMLIKQSHPTLRTAVETILAKLALNPNDSVVADNLKEFIEDLIKNKATTELKQALQLIENAGYMRQIVPLLEKKVVNLTEAEDLIWAIFVLDFESSLTQPLLERLRNRQQALELLANCNGQLPVNTALTTLAKVLELYPECKEARRKVDAQILAFIDTDRKQLERATKGNHLLPQAVEAFAQILKKSNTYREYMNNPDALQYYIKKDKELLADLFNRYKADNTIENKLAKLRYLELANSSDKITIAKLLEATADFHLNQNQLFEATLALSQAVELFVEFNQSNKLLDSRRKLRDCYDALELWDYSQKLSTKIAQTCPPSDLAIEKERAAKQISNDTHFYASHCNYLRNLHNYKNIYQFYSCFSSFLKKLIENEEKIFKYAG